MAYTKEEWEWIKPRFGVGCYLHMDEERVVGLVVDTNKIAFNKQGWVKDWNILNGMQWNLHRVEKFFWEDGTEIIPFVERDGKPYNFVLAKIKSLEARFKKKALPKTTQKALALP